MQLIARVIERTGTDTVLGLPDGQRLTVSSAELPAETAEGSPVTIVIGPDGSARSQAKALLNEILHPSSPS